MWLYFTKIKAYSLDLLLNKKILIRSIPYVNFIIAEDISDFSLNVFHIKSHCLKKITISTKSK